MDVPSTIAEPARQAIREAIDEAGGNEVFFIGRLGERGLVTDVEVTCRGSRDAVPALLDRPRNGDVVLHNHPSGQLAPSDADLALASRYGQDGVGFYIVDNAVASIYVVVEPHRARREQLDVDGVAAVFGPAGPLSDLHERFEHRPTQEAMARRVATCINGDGIALVEAGTGTGKSLAYLVPMVEHARRNRVRVAVSTGSINLQQQLVDKDIPLVRALLGEVRVALVKGRGNYLCRRKLADAAGRADELTEEEAAFIHRMGRWADTTDDGSLADLGAVPSGDLWEIVRSDADQTLRARCPFFQECFYYQARRRAAAADVLIANHHLLMADLEIKRATGGAGVLPRYDAVVVDEAHHLEDVATSMLTRTVTVPGMERLLGRLVASTSRRRGLVRVLAGRLGEGEAARRVRRRCDEGLVPAVRAARERLPVVIEEITAALRAATHVDEEGRAIYRMPTALDQVEERVRPIVDQIEVLRDLFGQVSAELGGVRRAVDLLDERWQEREIQLLFDLRAVHERVTGTIGSLGAVLEEGRESCRWIELRRGRRGPPRPRFCTAPVDVAASIRERVLDPVDAVVLTSATLAVDRSFDHVRARLGLDDGTLARERCETELLDSPFDLGRQVFAAVPRAFPEPTMRAHEEASAALIGRVVEAAQGRTFVLFTSYRALDRVRRALDRTLRGIRVLAQGTMERGRLLEEFRSGHRAVLLGTDSFWEGVDVPGRALSCVILARLPFRVPTEPIQRARTELVEARGGDPFRDYAVPQAVIRFRQGFGRLIRSRTDRGAVVILDPRVVSRSYGRVFLGSLPGLEVHLLGADDLVDGVRRFLA